VVFINPVITERYGGRMFKYSRYSSRNRKTRKDHNFF
jgi:hypothetical protein